MMNEKLLRLTVFTITVLLHLALILFFVIRVENPAKTEIQNARIMKLTDFNELPPVPPPILEEKPPSVIEEITEIYIETNIPPEINVSVESDISQVQNNVIAFSPAASDNYLPMRQLSSPPRFNENEIAASLVYPQRALRSGTEGRVFLELFVDHAGTVQRAVILREEPENWGFGEAAVKVFTGRKGTPALLNGEPVAARFRYPVMFRTNK